MALVITTYGDEARMYCTTSETTFGPTFSSEDAAYAFLGYKSRLYPGRDIRAFSDAEIAELHERWIATDEAQLQMALDLAGRRPARVL